MPSRRSFVRGFAGTLAATCLICPPAPPVSPVGGIWPAAGSAPAARAHVEPPRLVERAGWGAAGATRGYRDHQPRLATVHHTAVRWVGGDAAAHVRQIQAFHQGHERGWPDIAYHYLVDRDGTAYIGRPEAAAPDSATTYATPGHLTVCLLGNFEVQQPTGEQVEALARTLAWLLERHGLPLSAIGGHRDYAATSCPGLHVYSLLQDGSLAARVAALLTGASIGTGVRAAKPRSPPSTDRA